jgi:UDP-N-acetylenolpyruvoylglucosamine reductase
MVEQLTGASGWIRLAALQVEGDESGYSTEEQAAETCSNLLKNLNEAESMYFILPNGNGILISKHHGPIRILQKSGLYHVRDDE